MNDLPLRQHDFAPHPPRIRGLAALVPDVENLVDVVHDHMQDQLTIHYKNGMARVVTYEEIMGSPRQLPPMEEPQANDMPTQVEVVRVVEYSDRMVTTVRDSNGTIRELIHRYENAPEKAVESPPAPEPTPHQNYRRIQLESKK